MNLYATKRILDTVRERFPLYTWAYNPSGRVWECEVGYVARVFMLDDREDGREYTRLGFYLKNGVPIWVA